MEKKPLEFAGVTFEGVKIAGKEGWELYVNPEKEHVFLLLDGEVVSAMSGELLLELLIEKEKGNLFMRVEEEEEIRYEEV